jgi:glycosyltransferase involved in cell wall biosynthesis
MDAHVLITVGGLVERKGFHRVIAALPVLLERFSELHYVIVGGASAEGDWGERLRRQVAELGLQDRVHFLGSMPPEDLRHPLSAADVFVLASSNEGWANVILEAMACALPVVATDVGGNREVVRDDSVGAIVPFGDQAALTAALGTALERRWDREKILAYAQTHAWDGKIQALTQAFQAIHIHRPRDPLSTVRA